MIKSIIKIVFIIVAIVFILVVGLFTALVARVPLRLTKIFNSITIQEATRLAENCQIKTIAEPHIEGKYLKLIDGSEKYLEDKYQLVNHYRVYSDDYNKFFKLLYDSEIRCSFQVQSFIE